MCLKVFCPYHQVMFGIHVQIAQTQQKMCIHTSKRPDFVKWLVLMYSGGQSETVRPSDLSRQTHKKHLRGE